MADFKKVAELSEIGEGQISTAEVNGTAVALYKVNGQVFATMESCPHSDCSLIDFGKVVGDEVECECHGSRFKIKTGEPTRPPGSVALITYNVKVEDENVLVEV